MIKLVLTDIDNTLVPLGRPCASERAIAGVHALLDAGIAFGPATGRDVDGLERFFRGDSACWATGLASNGKLIFHGGELVKVVSLDHDQVVALSDLVAPVDDALLLVHAGGRDAIVGQKADVLARLDPSLMGPERMPFVDSVPTEPVTGCTVVCVGGPDRNKCLVAEAARVAPDLELLSPIPGCYDVVPRGWNKATALEELMGLMGVTPDEVVVFGDSENDVPILRMVPNSVVVGNAMPVAAAAARYRIGDCADDAVADALFDIVESSRRGVLPAFMRMR